MNDLILRDLIFDLINQNYGDGGFCGGSSFLEKYVWMLFFMLIIFCFFRKGVFFIGFIIMIFCLVVGLEICC